MPERLQFTLAAATEDPGTLVQERLGAILQALPETPYKAIGFNFVWRLEVAEVEPFTRRQFLKEETRFAGAVQTDTVAFGTRALRNACEALMTVDVEPVPKHSQRNWFLKIDINFHYQVSGQDAAAFCRSVLPKWDDAQREALKVAQALEDQNV